MSKRSYRRNQAMYEEDSANSSEHKQTNKPIKKINKRTIYKCGDKDCKRTISSSNAFTNHCRNQHFGKIPNGSMLNDQPLERSSGKLGRPTIQIKVCPNNNEISSKQALNKLIDFLGKLETNNSDKLLVYVESPLQRMENSLNKARQLNKSQQYHNYYNQISVFNKIVSANDLPEIYDPIKTDKYKDKLDSYSFNSIYKFMIRQRKIHQIKDQKEPLLMKTILAYLVRYLCTDLLTEVIYIVAQIHFKEKQLISRKIRSSQKWIECIEFKNLLDSFFKCVLIEDMQPKQKVQEQLQQQEDQGYMILY